MDYCIGAWMRIVLPSGILSTIYRDMGNKNPSLFLPAFLYLYIQTPISPPSFPFPSMQRRGELFLPSRCEATPRANIACVYFATSLFREKKNQPFLRVLQSAIREWGGGIVHPPTPSSETCAVLVLVLGLVPLCLDRLQ